MRQCALLHDIVVPRRRTHMPHHLANNTRAVLLGVLACLLHQLCCAPEPPIYHHPGVEHDAITHPEYGGGDDAAACAWPRRARHHGAEATPTSTCEPDMRGLEVIPTYLSAFSSRSRTRAHPCLRCIS